MTLEDIVSFPNFIIFIIEEIWSSKKKRKEKKKKKIANPIEFSTSKFTYVL